MNDLLINGDYDLTLKNGDFVIGFSDNIETDLILRTAPGEWKHNPTVGADLQSYLLDENLLGLKTNIKKQLLNDGKTPKRIDIINGKLIVEL